MAGSPPTGFGAHDVVVADNDASVRRAIGVLVGDHPGLRLVGEATDGLVAAELCGRLHPRLALVDIRMPHGGAEAVAAILLASPATSVVGYTSMVSRRAHRHLLDAGAVAVLVKGGSVDLADELVGIAHVDPTAPARAL